MLLAATACLPSFPDDECYADVDCPSDLVCSAENRCIQLVVRRDGGVLDGSTRDSGRRDSGVLRDAGPTRDGGPRDAGVDRDGGPRDAGFDLRISDAMLDFGLRTTACPGATQRLTLENRGAMTARVDGIQLTNGTSTEYTFVAPTPPFNLPSLQARTIDVTYAPTNVGLDEGGLQIRYANSTGTIEVALSGEGQSAAQVTETFTASAGPLDVLFAVDSAAMMGMSQAYLAGRMVFTLSLLDIAGWNYNIAVTTLDTTASGAAGTFVSSPSVITPTTPNRQSQLQASLMVGETGPAERRGFDAVEFALTSPLIDGPNAGFLRADAPLLVIFVSADDDESMQSPAAHLTFLQNLKAATMQPVLVNTITPTSFACTLDGNATGFEGVDYIDIATASGGVVSNMCGNDWDDAVTTFPPPTARLTYPLADTPVSGAVTVEVDMIPVPSNGGANWTYDAVDNEVVFTESAAPATGASVAISYEPDC